MIQQAKNQLKGFFSMASHLTGAKSAPGKCDSMKKNPLPTSTLNAKIIFVKYSILKFISKCATDRYIYCIYFLVAFLKL